jgi:hypothetical protein
LFFFFLWGGGGAAKVKTNGILVGWVGGKRNNNGPNRPGHHCSKLRAEPQAVDNAFNVFFSFSGSL